jgi:Ca2+-binding EF-hand superfamily protein
VPGFGNEFEARPVPGFGRDASDADSLPSNWQARYDQRTLDLVRDIIRRNDRDGSGALERDEWEGIPWRNDPRQSDTDGDGVLTAQELAARIGGAVGTRGSLRYIASQAARRNVSSSAINRQRSSVPFGSFRTAHEMLPEGLPAWFRDQDANADGQISMSEFSSAWSDSLVEEFRRWDLNNDGLIVPGEVLQVLGKNVAHDEGKSRTPRASVAASSSAIETVKNAPADDPALRQKRRTSALVQILLQRYDRDRSGALETAEWDQLPSRIDPASCDLNQDGRLSPEELAARLKE